MLEQDLGDNELFTIDEVGDHSIKQEDVNTDSKPIKKTKKQKEDEIRSHKTLFVRNVPQLAKDNEFEEFFEKFGPLKTCFLVRNPTDKKCKGFGFVTFSMKEDAEKSIEVCKKEEFLGKLLKLEWAIKKSIDDKNSAKEKEGIPLKKKSTKSLQKSDLNILDRTVAITNLSNSTGRPQLLKFLEEHGHSAQDLQYKGGRGLAIAVFETVEIAQIVVSSLQNQTLQKNKLEIQFLSQLISKTKVNRLILRNLPFQLSDPELLKLGNGIGAVVECKIQRHSETNKPLGFGFLQFLAKEQSEAAIDQLNNKEVYGRKITINWCSGKDFQVKDEENDFDIKEEANEDELENYGQNAKMFEDNQSDEMLTSDESSSEDEDEDEEENDENEDEGEDEEAKGSDNDMDVEGEDEDENEDEDVSTNSDEPNTTLFIRNILFETTEQDLFDHFTEFGPVKYARIVMDSTGRSRGTGFVKFYKSKDAKKVLDEAKAAKAILPGAAPTTKSVLKLELPQFQSSTLMLQDRLLDVVLAVDKEEATKLAAPNKNKDKKNLYLLKEGIVFPKTPEAEGLPETEITKRLQSHDLRKRQLEKNPSLFISKTRLAIRNMPLDWTDKELRTLAREAIPNFKREAKEGKRADLTKQEKAEGWDHKPKLKQVKVEVDKKQVNATTNKAKSKGFGFVEFEQHSHALAALRYLNCNPSIKGLDKEAKEAKKSQESKGRTNRRMLLVEFSVENKLVLKRRDDRKRKLETIQKTTADNKNAKNNKKDETPFKKQKRTKAEDTDNPKKKKKFFHKRK